MSIKPLPPENTLFCDMCGTLSNGKHTSIICRLFNWIDNMTDSREKGARAETLVRDFLRKHTGLKWERVPGSGALDEKHGLKGDLYIPSAENIYCVEVKHYADDQVSTKLLYSTNPTLKEWWMQAVRQAKQVNRKPLLIFKHDRSKIFVAYDEPPSSSIRHLYLFIDDSYGFYMSLLEDYLNEERPFFIK